MNGLGGVLWEGASAVGVAWVVLQGSILVLIAGVVAFLCRRAPAAGRHALWSLAVAGVFALPALSSFSPIRFPVAVPSWGSNWADLPADRVAGKTLATGSASAATAIVESEIVRPAPPTVPIRGEGGDSNRRAEAVETKSSVVTPVDLGAKTSAGFGNLPMVLGFAWAFGAMILVGRFLLGAAMLSRMIRTGRPASRPVQRAAEQLRLATGVRRPVRLVVNDSVTSPMTWGARRPVILLPPEAGTWDDSRVRVVLTHELAHIARVDVVTKGIAALTRAVHWFNPLVWWAASRQIAEAERACDDWVLRLGERPSDYADHLLALATVARPRPLVGAAASPMAQRSGFEGRILSILAAAPRGRFGPLAGGGVVAVGIAIILLVGSAVPGVASVAPAEGTTVTQSPFLEAEVSESRGAPEEAGNPLDLTTVGTKEEGGWKPRPGRTEPATPESSGVALPSGSMGAVQEVGALDRMILALSDEDVVVRSSMVRALAKQMDPRAVRALMDALATDVDAGVRESAAWALGQIEAEDAVPALVEAMGGDDAVAVRRTATWALGQIEDADAVPGLGEALDDPDDQVRETALWALGQIESPTAVPYLSRGLSDSSPEVRRNAVWALGQIEVEEAVPALVDALNDEDAEVRRSAAWALGQVESASAVPALVGVLADPVVGVRHDAVWALGQIESERAVPNLTGLLSDEDEEVRSTVAWALGQIEPNDAPAELVGALEDPAERVRQSAAWALGKIQDPSSVAALLGLLESSTEGARLGAIQALGTIRSEAAVEAIAAFLDDADPEVKRAAARALAGGRGWSGSRPRPRPRPHPRPRPRPRGWEGD